MSFATFSIAETMLRNRERFFSEIKHDVALKEKIQAMDGLARAVGIIQ